MKRRNLILANLILFIFLIVFFFSLHHIVFWYQDNQKTDEQIKKLQNIVKINEPKNSITTELLDDSRYSNVDLLSIDFTNLLTINEEIVGWIEIPDTNINYPVLQGTDNEYYINHNYKHEKTSKGSIFLNKDYNWETPSCNLLIYGHNMKNGEMFQDLLNYSSKTYYQEHPIIRFTTANEDAEYEIMSAFKSRVYYKSEENVFRYYNFLDAETEEEYNNFVENAKTSSLYDTGISAQYKDPLITLITCSYHVQDGRFVVIGRKK